MNPINPADHGAYTDVAVLLKILSDPAKHKSRLDELIAQENAAKEQIAALNAMAADTRRQNSAAAALTIVLNNRKTALDEREAALDEKAKHLDLGSAASLKRRETAVHAREEAATREEARLAAIRTELDGKHKKIQNLAGALTH
jgi:hypothetical protein